MSLVVDLTVHWSKYVTLAIRDWQIDKILLLSSPFLFGEMRKQKSKKITSFAHVHMAHCFQSKDQILGMFDWLLSKFFPDWTWTW